MNILLVEDDLRTAFYLERSITAWGHDVRQADSGAEALEMAGQETFDLVLLDIFLPDTEGYKLIPELREQNSRMEFVSMTGSNSRELEAKVRGAGVLYYLIKPFEIQNLKTILDHMSRRRHPAESA